MCIRDRYGLAATMQVALVASLAFHAAAIVGLGFKVPDPRAWDAPHNVLDVVLVNAKSCLLYTSDAADERSSVDLGGRRIIKKKKKAKQLLDSTKKSRAEKSNTLIDVQDEAKRNTNKKR